MPTNPFCLFLRVMAEELWNHSSLSSFILAGLFGHSPYDSFFFSLVLLAFGAAVVGNILLLMVIQVDRRLHTPMYFFLSQLSIMEPTARSWARDITLVMAHLLSWGWSPSSHGLSGVPSSVFHAGPFSFPKPRSQPQPAEMYPSPIIFCLFSTFLHYRILYFTSVASDVF